MLRVKDDWAKKQGMRIVEVPSPKTAMDKLRDYEQQTGRNILAQIKEAHKNCSDDYTATKIISFQPVPRPDYEEKYGGPYSHIIKTMYCEKWGCVFGLRTDGTIVLWMD